MGYYDCITPSVILRNVFENPGWYTPYTPYQAEIAQGRLESLLNFQTVVRDLTGMDIATASLLDEGTAAAEAMTMFHRLQTKKAPAGQESVFLVSDRMLPADDRRPARPGRTARHPPRDRRPGDAADGARRSACCCSIRTIAARCATCGRSSRRRMPPGCWWRSRRDLLALTLLTPPGEMGADAVVGNSQRFGVPLGYGGPHAGVLRDARVVRPPGARTDHRHVGGRARATRRYRMALQTREQHIRREKATSNICTAQALLANIAAMYAVYHGPHGLRAIAERVHDVRARRSKTRWRRSACAQTNAAYFDTLRIEGADVAGRPRGGGRAGHQFPLQRRRRIGISVDETTTHRRRPRHRGVFGAAEGADPDADLQVAVPSQKAPRGLKRTSHT